VLKACKYIRRYKISIEFQMQCKVIKMKHNEMKFGIIPDEEIQEGRTTDIYFIRTEEVLRQKGVNPRVVAEVNITGGGWTVLAGLEEVAHLLAGDVPVISFDTRRQHPALAAIIERCAYLGGMDGVSNVAGADRIGLEATGTMPHSLIICFGDQKEAWQAFDEVIAKKVPRICLCDTYYDEKTESILAAEALGKSLHAVRLDTPTSRKGDFRQIIEEVRWELDARGFKDVGIFISGGIDEETVVELRDVVAGFGVGTCVSNAKSIDLALDIIERDGEPCAKRGKRGGKKQVYRGSGTIRAGNDVIRLAKEAPPKDKVPLLQPMILNGSIVADFSFSLEEARKLVQEQLTVIEGASIS